VDPQIIGTVTQIGGAAGGLGVVIWLVILVLKQVERGRTMDQESMGNQIKELKEQVAGLRTEVVVLISTVENERRDRVAAQEALERARLIIIRHGLEGELNDSRAETT
jgi:hypothetical protein